MKKGTVKWFVTVRGLGFITGEDGTEAMVSAKNIAGKDKFLEEGQQVTYEVTSDPRDKNKLIAYDVKPL